MNPAWTHAQNHAQNNARCIKLTIAYDGSEFFGWQRQRAARTVQETLETALENITGAPKVRLLASSRTDTGVHALGQCATFRTATWKSAASNIAFAVNTQLPPDVIVRSACEAPFSFNPIRHAISKRYRYSVYASRISDPIGRRQAWWVKRSLDIEAMRTAAAHLLGTHDFASFQTMGSPRISTIRSVQAIDIDSRSYLDGQWVSIEIQANGFLYNMVRNIVGTLVQVGRGTRSIQWVPEVLVALDRKQAGQTAPAHGLCLLDINFDQNALRLDGPEAMEAARIHSGLSGDDQSATFSEELSESEQADLE